MNNLRTKEAGRAGSPARAVLVLSLVVSVIGCIGYFSLPRGPIIFYIFAHLGALGLLGLIGSGIGALAKRKGRSYWMAFWLGGPLPIVLGLIAAAIVGDHWSCGGSVSLAVAAVVALSYAFMSKRAVLETGRAG